MNHPNSVRIDQAASVRPLVADRPRLTAAHISAVDPALLDRVRPLFNDIHKYSNQRQVCESSFTPRLSYSMPRDQRLLDPASLRRDMLSDCPKYATHDIRPGEQLPAVDLVKPDNVTAKKLDGWLPAPSGLKRKGIAVTGQNLPQALNEREDKSTSEVFPFKDLYATGTDVKGRKSDWDQRVQGFPAPDKPPWPMPHSVNDSFGRWSEDQRLARQNAEGTCTSSEMRGLPVNHSASSLVIKPGHYSQVAEGENASVSVRQQRGDVSLPGSALNSMCIKETAAWRPMTVSRTVSQGKTKVDTSSAGKSPFPTGNAPYANSDIVVARKIFPDHKRIEFESFGKTVLVLKTARDDMGAPSRDSLELKGSRNSFDSRSRSHERTVPSTQSNRTEMSSRGSARDEDMRFSKRSDLGQKVNPVEAREKSRFDVGEEMIRRARTDRRKVEDGEKNTSESESGLPVRMDYKHRSSKQEPSRTDRKSSVERDQFSGRVQVTDSLKLKDQSKASTKESSRKSEDRSRSKKSKALTDEYLRTKFLLEIGRREKELRRIADNSGSLGSIGVRLPNIPTGVSLFEVDRERWPMKPELKEPSCDSVAVKRYDSERTNSHTMSGSVSSSHVLQDYPSRHYEDTAYVLADRSRKADEANSKEFEDFRRPLPPAKTSYRTIEPSAGEKQRNLSSENSMDVKKQISNSQSYSRNTKESTTLSEHRLSGSASRDSSASDGNRASASARHKTDPEREVRDGFQNEERIAYWENLKAQLDDLCSKKRSPVKSPRRSSEDKSVSQSKDSCQVKEAGRRTPKRENSEDQGKFRVKMEHTSKKENTDEQSKARIKMEHTPKRENTEEQSKLRVKMEHKPQPAEERKSDRFSQSREAKKGNVEIQDRLPVKTKQSVRPHQEHSSNRSQKGSGQDKAERQTTHTDQVHSLNRSQKVSDQDKAERNATSKQKMTSRRPSETVGKTDFDRGHKDFIPKIEEKYTTDEKQDAKKRKIVNKNVSSKSIRPLMAETNKKGRNDKFPRLEIAEREDIALEEAHKSDDLRNLLNSKPSNTSWRQREIRREKDDRSVVLKDITSSEDEELVIEVPAPRNRRPEGTMSVGSGGRREIEGLDDPRGNARRWRGVDDGDDSELPRKRFKFNQTASELFARGGFGPRGRGRRGFEAKSHFQKEFQHRYKNAVNLDDYRRVADDDDADLDDRRPGRQDEYGNPDEGYLHTDDRISNPRDRYQGGSRDRYPAGDNTREQFPGEEPIDQHQGADLYPGDADERFQRNDDEYFEDGKKKYPRGNYNKERYPKRKSDRESYDDRYSDEDTHQRGRGDFDGRFSDDCARGHSRQKSSTRFSNDDSPERYRENRSARYSSDDGKEPYHSEQYRNDAEHSGDVREPFQGPYTDRYTRKPSRGRFVSPNARTVTFDRLKGPRAFLKDLEQNCVDDDYAEERPCDIEVTVEGDLHEDDSAWNRRDTGYQEGEAVSDGDFEDIHDQTDSREFEYGGLHNETVPLSPDEQPLHTGARFGGPSRGSSFRTRSWRGRFLHKSARGNRFQPRLAYRGRFGFQPQCKKFLPTPKKFMRMAEPEFAGQSGDNISEASNSIQEAMKQVISSIKEAEMADPEADAALFDTLSRGEKKQVIEIQQMTGIQCITAIVTALRTLWEFEPKVVRTLGNLEPEEIKQLGDDG